MTSPSGIRSWCVVNLMYRVETWNITRKISCLGRHRLYGSFSQFRVTFHVFTLYYSACWLQRFRVPSPFDRNCWVSNYKSLSRIYTWGNNYHQTMYRARLKGGPQDGWTPQAKPGQAEVVSKSSNKINQTWGPPFSRAGLRCQILKWAQGYSTKSINFS